MYGPLHEMILCEYDAVRVNRGLWDDDFKLNLVVE